MFLKKRLRPFQKGELLRIIQGAYWIQHRDHFPIRFSKIRNLSEKNNRRQIWRLTAINQRLLLASFLNHVSIQLNELQAGYCDLVKENQNWTILSQLSHFSMTAVHHWKMSPLQIGRHPGKGAVFRNECVRLAWLFQSFQMLNCIHL